MEWIYLAWGRTGGGHFECDNKRLGSIKLGEFLD